MEISKALELGLEWADKRMASELTEMDKEYILTGIKASLIKNCYIPDVVCSANWCMSCEVTIKKDEGLLFCGDCGM